MVLVSRTWYSGGDISPLCSGLLIFSALAISIAQVIVPRQDVCM